MLYSRVEFLCMSTFYCICSPELVMWLNKISLTTAIATMLKITPDYLGMRDMHSREEPSRTLECAICGHKSTLSVGKCYSCCSFNATLLVLLKSLP